MQKAPPLILLQTIQRYSFSQHIRLHPPLYVEEKTYVVFTCIKWQSVHCICTIRGPVLWGQDVCSKDQHNAVKGPTLWVMCKGPTNPMGIHLWGHDACTEDQSYGTVHVATRPYVQSQVALYHVRGPGTQYAQRVVVKWNTSTEHTCNNTQIKSVACKHAQQQSN